MMIILYILCIMWGVGCVSLPIVFAYDQWTDYCGSRISAVFVIIIGLPIFLVLAVLPFMAVWSQNSQILAELKKDEWQCVQSHQQTSTTYVKIGSVLSPVTSTENVCDEYERK